MLRRTFFIMLMLLATVNASRSVNAHESDVDLEDHILRIESDDSHDVIVVRENPEDPDEIEVLILQFDDPVSLYDYSSEEEIIDAADDFRDEYYNYDNVDAIEVNALGGDDWVIVDGSINQPCKLIGGLGSDYITSGSGHDTIWGDEEFVTSGSAGGEDNLDGNGGEDVIHGGPLDDTIRGGAHDDELHGDDGEDTMYGESGNDDMFGGNHDDTMRGGSNDDEMHGEAGEDTMDGDSGNDDMFGGDQDDTMYGGTGDDEMHGENGNDDLFGEDGEDELFGGNDNDLLDGSYDGEMDTLEGGAGVDEFVNRYYETRTYVYYRAEYYYAPRLIWVRGFPQIIYERQVVWVPVTGTYQYNFEIEFVNDFSYADGDIFSPIEVN